jgi:hypothetical protein
MPEMNDAEAIGARLYRFLYRYRETYATRFEAFVLVLEIVLIVLGLTLSVVHVFEDHPDGPRTPARMWEMAHDFSEVPVFVVLLLLALSRSIVKLRTLRLGYAYEPAVALLEGTDPEKRRRFFKAIEAVPIGQAPGMNPEWAEHYPYYADKIAHQTASLLSVRSWLLRDEQWRSREQDSLSDWFKVFPAGLWQCAPSPTSQDLPTEAGYFSVAIPMTPQSARSLRRGLRATDMAEVDPAAIRAFRLDRGPTDAPLRRAELLAYLHIHVPQANETRDDLLLLAASFQHLAYLLFGLFGVEGDYCERWNFNLLCESSNQKMNLVLRSMGFAPVVRERDGSETQEREARSYAGFLLFELKVDEGNCDEGNALSFLNLLRRLVAEHAKKLSKPTV